MENIGKFFHDIGWDSDFQNMTPKALGTKENRKIGLHQN